MVRTVLLQLHGHSTSHYQYDYQRVWYVSKCRDIGAGVAEKVKQTYSMLVQSIYPYTNVSIVTTSMNFPYVCAFLYSIAFYFSINYYRTSVTVISV